MSRKRESEFAITEVIAETIGGAVHVALSPKELTENRRRQLLRSAKRPKYLSVPCKVDVSLRIDEFEKKRREKAEVHLFVNGIPPPVRVLRFLRDLTPVKVEVGQPIELDCEIEAEPDVKNIAWLKDGMPIKGDRFRTSYDRPRIVLRILRSTAEDAGDYMVIAANEDSDISSTAPVTVHEKPVFVEPLKDLTVHLNDKALLTCRLRALPPAVVTWLEAGIELRQTERRRLGRDGEVLTLTIDGVTVDDLKKTYACHAVNDYGMAQTSAKLIPAIPLTPPEFVERFHDKSVEEERQLVIKAKVTGYPKPVVTWKRKDIALKPDENLSMSEIGDGKYSLTIKKVTKDSADSYVCVAENPVGTAKCEARISVTEKMLPPVFIVNLSNQEATEADDTKFSCTVQGRPIPTISWIVNDEEVKDGDRLQTSETRGLSDVSAQLTVKNLTVGDSGEFKAVAKNPAGVAYSEATLRVKVRTVKPRVLKGPVDQKIMEDEDATFAAVVDGIPDPKIQWYKDGQLIQPSDSAIHLSEDVNHWLTIKKAQLNDKGTYTIKATNVAGEVSASAKLDVIEKLWPPVFTKRLADEELIEDDDVTFVCSVNAKPLPVITWLKDGKELKASQRVKQEAMKVKENEVAISLSILKSLMTDSGEIRIIARNSEGEAEDSATFKVNMRTISPKILKGPEDQEIYEEEEGHFFAVIDGKPSPTIQWLKDGRSLKPSDVVIYANKDQTHSLTVRKAKLDDKGLYTVKAFNIAGEEAASAKLTVKEKLWAPFFTEKLIDETITEDDSVSFQCCVNAKPPPSVMWLKDGKELIGPRVKLDHAKINPTVQKFALVLSKAEMTDAGEIQVVAKNSEGTADDSAILVVNMRTIPPMLLKGPSDVTITEHEDAFFSASVDGRPEPKIQWLKGGRPILPSEEMTFESQDKAFLLRIKNAKLSDKGIYTIRATNVAGEITADATLNVKEKLWPPIFTKKMTDKSLIENDDITFTCNINANPLPNVICLCSGKDVSKDPRFKMEHSEETKNEIKVILSLRDAQIPDSGEFKVVARNSEGEATDTALLTVAMRKVKPTILKGPADVSITEGEEASFTATVAGKPTPKVEWLKDNVVIVPSADRIYSDKDQLHTVTIRNAQLSDRGRYTVRATNDAGEAVASASLTVKERLWAPVFTERMVDKTITEDDQIEFHCVVYAKPTPEITCLKDGVDAKLLARISCERKAGLENHLEVIVRLRDAQMTDTGELKVVAKNSEGEAQDGAKLIVKMRIVKPSIVEGPTDLTITETEQARFIALVDGRPEPSIQWLKDGKLVRASKTTLLEIIGKSHSLTVLDSHLDDAGIYTINAVNEGGAIEASARLTVKEKLWAPFFTKKLSDENVVEMDDVYLRCSVDAKPAPMITWLKDGRELADQPRVKRDSVKGLEHQTNLTLHLTNAEISDSGEFKVVARNAVGEASESARVLVKMRMLKPTLLKGPEDLTVVEDDDSHFVAVIDGKPEPKIHWFRDDVLLKHSSVVIFDKKTQTHLLTIRNSRLEDQGTYTIKAINDAGEVTANARLTVKERLWAPVFKIRMTDQEVLEQDDASFFCSVSGKPIPSIACFKAGQELQDSPRVKLEQTRAKDEVKVFLIFGRTDLGDPGEIKVIARNSEGEAVDAAKLLVKMRTLRPMLLKGPTDLTVTEGEDGYFAAAFTGKPEPTINWYKDDKLIRPSATMICSTNDQTHWLTIKASHMSDAGRYAVQAVNEAGEESASAQLHVKEKLWAPIFTKRMTDETILEKDSFTFRCSVSAKPIPTLTWLKNGKELVDGPRMKRDFKTLIDNEVNVTVTITDAQMSDSGDFTISAKNSEGEATNIAKLTVKMRTLKPTLLKGPTDLTITEQEDGVFYAAIEGKPEPTVRWFKDEVLVMSSETAIHAKRDQTYSLTIKRALLDDGGLYTVKAANEAGELTASARLTVKEKLWAPVFTEKMSDATALENDEVQFRCTVSAKPLPQITCVKDDSELPESSRIRCDLQRRGDSEVSVALSFADVELSDSGDIKVVARNSQGKATDTAVLLVKMRTKAPSLLKKPDDLVLMENENGHFLAAFEGRPEPTVHWFKDEKQIKPSKHMLHSKDGQTHTLTVNDAQLSFGGLYVVKAVNEAGEYVTSANLTVKEKLWPPIFTEKLVNKSVIEGDEDIRFRCTVNAKPLPQITWHKDGKQFKGTTRMEQEIVKGRENELKLTLLIRKIEMEDAGTFEVVAENVEGTASNLAKLSVTMRTVKPAIIKGPTDLVIFEEESGSFSATITGKPAPRVEWWKDGRLVKPSDIMIYSSQDQTHSLTVRNAKLDDKGSYTIKAVNEAGEISANATLTVKEKLWPPIFTEKLVNKSVIEGDEDIRFRCTVNAKPLPQITWHKDGKQFKGTTRIEQEIVKGRENELKLALLIRKIEMEDAGTFEVVAENVEGTASNLAKLSVTMRTVKPAIIKGPTDLVIFEEESGSFSATITGKPAPRVEWWKDGRLIRQSDVMIYSSQDQTHSLTVRNAKLDDKGSYTIKAVNEAGEISANAKLTVKEKLWPPIFTEKLVNKSVIEGDEDIRFRCTVNAKPLPQITWHKDGKQFKGTTRMEQEIAKGRENELKLTLLIRNVEMDDAGTFEVVAENVEGVASNLAKLSVTMRTIKPAIVKGPTDLVIFEEESGSFSATITGKPAPRVEWWKDGRLIKPSDVMIYSSQDQTHSLTVRNAKLDDKGSYTIKAVNEAGETSANAKLIVKERLWAPIFIEKMADVTLTDHEDIVLKCVVSAKPQPTITWSKAGWEFKDDHRTRIGILKQDGDKYSLTLTVKDCEMADAGEITVKAKNSEGEAEISAEITISMQITIPILLSGPEDLLLTEEGEGTFYARVGGYPEPNVQWFKGQELIKPSEDRIMKSKDAVHSLTIKNAKLQDAATYTVKATNLAGDLVLSAKLTVKAKSVKPTLLKGPANLTIEEGQSASFSAVVDGNPVPKVEWLKNSVVLRDGDRFVIKAIPTEYTLTVKDAKMSDAGQYTVRATNEAGQLKASATLSVIEPSPYFLDMLNDVTVSEGMPANFTCKVYPAGAKVTWYIEDEKVSPADKTYRMTSKGNERRLEIVRATRLDNGKVSVEVGELQSHATLTVEASETEIVETRLFWEQHDFMDMSAAAEFQCVRGTRNPSTVMRVQSIVDPRVSVSDPVHNAAQRRWIVEKAFISREGLFRVERWTVRSYVDYTCAEESVKDVALGKLDGVKFSKQTVEFLVLLTEPTGESKWLKNGKLIEPGAKYQMAIEDEGLLHRMTVNDVQPTDEGIYTFLVLREDVTLHYIVEGTMTPAPTAHPPLMSRAASRLMSRQDIDTKELVDRLPSAVKKAKSTSQLVFEYDNRHRDKSAKSEFVQSQLHAFDNRITEFDTDENAFYSDEGEEGEKAGEAGRRLSRGDSSDQGRMSRSKSLTSVATPRSGRPKSEILYFTYVESGKEMDV